MYRRASGLFKVGGGQSKICGTNTLDRYNLLNFHWDQGNIWQGLGNKWDQRSNENNWPGLGTITTPYAEPQLRLAIFGGMAI